MNKALVINTETGAVKEVPESSIGCDICGHLACVCDIKARHKKNCPFRRAAICTVAIECEHGRDVCPECDPCTCNE